MVQGVAFTEEGEEMATSPDGREALPTEAPEILERHQSCHGKWKDSVSWFLGVPAAEGCTKKQITSSPPPPTRNKATEKGGEPSATARNMENTGESARELHKVPSAIVPDVGKVTQESPEGRILEAAAIVPLFTASIRAGARRLETVPSHAMVTRDRTPSFLLDPSYPPFSPAARASGPSP